MSNSNFTPSVLPDTSPASEEASFADILSNFEQQHRDEHDGQTITGTVISCGPETILVDIGRKIEGSLALANWRETADGRAESRHARGGFSRSAQR